MLSGNPVEVGRMVGVRLVSAGWVPTSAVVVGTAVGTGARAVGGIGWLAAGLLCTAALVAIGQQTLP